MSLIRIPVESRLLLFAASFLVPRALRADWRMEWQGEIWWWLAGQPEAGRSVRERLALLCHCAGAASDGFCLWLEEKDRVSRLRTALQSPITCLAAGLLLIATIAGLSGGFEKTRRCFRAALQPHSRPLALLSQTAPFMGLRNGVPPRKVEYWNLHSATLEGAAVYASYRTVAGSDSFHSSDLPGAKVGDRLFSLLATKAHIGRLFVPGDLQSCRSCAVIGFEFWKRRLGADPRIIGRTIIVDNRPFRVIGVLTREFWLPGDPPAVWSLFDKTEWRSFSIPTTAAICRLKPGIKPAVAEQELRKLAREVAPAESGTFVTVNPLDEIASWPIRSLGPLFLAFVGLTLLCGFVKWITRGDVAAGAFWIAKTVLLCGAIFLAGFEFGGAASITSIGSRTVAAGTAFCWLLIAGSLSIRWSWNDQRKRCRRCLSRLMLPVRIGEASRVLLEPSGLEMSCPRGHGLLFTSEVDSIAPRDTWYPLEVACDSRVAT